VTEIEFLDPGPATSGPDGVPHDGSDGGSDGGSDDTDGPDLRRLAPALAAAVAWVLAAGLAVMASVSTVYRLVYTSDGLHQKITVDAWGRFQAPRLFQTFGHQTRYAIVLIAAAVLLLAAALIGIVRLAVARYLAVTGAAVAAGVTTMLFLLLDATRSTNAAQAARAAQATDFSLSTETGSAVWLALGATVAAVVGIVLAFVLKAPDESPPANDADAYGAPENGDPEYDAPQYDAPDNGARQDGGPAMG